MIILITVSECSVRGRPENRPTSINEISFLPAGIPPDGTPRKVIDTVHIGLVVVYDFFATVGIVSTLGCLVFNFVFKNRK